MLQWSDLNKRGWIISAVTLINWPWRNSPKLVACHIIMWKTEEYTVAWFYIIMYDQCDVQLFPQIFIKVLCLPLQSSPLIQLYFVSSSFLSLYTFLPTRAAKTCCFQYEQLESTSIFHLRNVSHIPFSIHNVSWLQYVLGLPSVEKMKSPPWISLFAGCVNQ